MTITNLNEPTQTPTSRLLAATQVTDIGIKVESTSQPDSGLLSFGLSLLSLCSLSLLALF